METKRNMVIRFMKEEKYKEAMKIAKGFKIELNEEQRSIVTRGYESYTNPRFYISLHQDIQENIRKAIEVLKEIYKGEI